MRVGAQTGILVGAMVHGGVSVRVYDSPVQLAAETITENSVRGDIRAAWRGGGAVSQAFQRERGQLMGTLVDQSISALACH